MASVIQKQPVPNVAVSIAEVAIGLLIFFIEFVFCTLLNSLGKLEKNEMKF